MNFNQISTGGPEDMPKSTITWTRSDDSFFARQGWICPKCGRVYSPSTEMCLYCGGNTNIMPSTTTKILPDIITHVVEEPWNEP